MLSILSTFTYTDLAAFPNTGAVDASGGTATDGTEFIAAMINDYMFGILQAELDYTGQTPNGSLEGPSNSQHLEALRRSFSYPGDIVISAINDDPATLGIRAIKLIGQGIVRANYPLLDAAVYVGDANNAAVAAAGGAFFRADNSDGSSPNTTGAYLILPDMRGQTIRGLDTAAAVDPDGASRYLGDVQDFALENIVGSFQTKDLGASTVVSLPTGVFSQSLANGSTAVTITYSGSGAMDTLYFDASTVAQTSTETRMTNVCLNFYIRY